MHMTKNQLLKIKAPFVSCISKISNTLTDNGEDLDIVMPLPNLLEYSKNYSKFGVTTEMNQTVVQITTYTIQLRVQNLLITKQVLPENQNVTTQKKKFAPLKHLSNFWRTLDMPLINCEINPI